MSTLPQPAISYVDNTKWGNIKPLTIYVGYDSRESHLYDLCVQSLQKTANLPIEIIPLKHRELRSKGDFYREWKIDAKGQFIDLTDGKPFSTEFSHTRFLVPSLERQRGHTSGLAMFVDCDFLFCEDVYKVFEEAAINGYDKAVSVVKHNYKPKTTVKMDGMQQVTYNKKLWTSLMVFNLGHPDTQTLTTEEVNTRDGSYLHQLQWIKDDGNIGSINEKWNFIPEHSEERVNVLEIGAIHYTEGAPCLTGYENCPYSYLYYEQEKDFFFDRFIQSSQAVHSLPNKLKN